MSQLLEVSESALRTLQHVLPHSPHGAPAVRVGARLADTGTPAYDLSAMDSTDGPAAGDTVVTLDGLMVYVDLHSAPLLKGVRIDHLQTPRATGFLFRPSDAQLYERVKTALDTARPRLQADGGDVELVEVREGRAVLAPGKLRRMQHGKHDADPAPGAAPASGRSELVAVIAQTVRSPGPSMAQRGAEEG